MNNFFLSHRNPILAVLIVLLAGGIFSYSKMQSSLFPEVTFPKIKIIAENGLQPVSKMMITVTKPLENTIKHVPDLINIRSITSRGSCEISAYLNWNADIDLSKQQIESAINQVKNNLPAGCEVVIEKMNPSILPVIGYIIEGKNKSNIELNQIAINLVKPFLIQENGVSDVRVIGGKNKEYKVELMPQKMSALGITPSDVTTALEQTNFIKSNGYLTDYNRLYLTITDVSVKNIDDFQNLVLKNDGKRILRLQDIANIKISEETQFIRVNANGENAILVTILKQPNTNLIDLTKGIKSRVNELNNTILPKGITLKPYYTQADFVKSSIESVNTSIWIGLFLAIVVAIIFLRSVKSSAVILITIPITLSFTYIIMKLLNFNFNIMTLGAIAASIGLIIDDAIVVVEQIHRTHEEHPETPTRELLSRSINFLFPAMIGSSLSTIVIFFPFVLLSGVAGAYFSILTDTMMIVLVCSFFVTWIGLPVIYLIFSSDVNTVKARPVQNIHKQGRWISYFITRPALSYLFIAFLLGLLFIIPGRLESGFLPDMDEGSIVMDYKSPPGTSLQETDRMLREAEKTFDSIPEIESYSRRTGTEMGFFITEPNVGDNLIQLKKDRKRSVYEIIDDIRNKIQTSQPALQLDFGQVMGDMLGDLISSKQPVEVKIYGDNQHVLQNIAKQVADITSHVEGTADVFNGITIAGPSVTIDPDEKKLAQFGITPADFQNQMQIQLEGQVLGNIQEKEQLTALRMQYPNAVNTSLYRLSNSNVFLPNGVLEPVSLMAKIEIDTGIAEIERENLQSMIPVTASLDNRDLGGVMKELKSKIASGINLPQGYHIHYGGAYEEQQKSFGELMLILLLAALFVFTVILFLFKKFIPAIIIVTISALGISGSLLALYLTHTPLNVGSYTGIIMIIGIIGENAIFTFLQFSHSLKSSTTDEAIVYAISTRLRPKLMTALGAIIALSPIAMGIGSGAQLHQPLAIAVIGGFLIALPLLLIVYPSMLRSFYKS